MSQLNGKGPLNDEKKSGRGLGKCQINSSEKNLEKLGKGMGERFKSGGGKGNGKRLKSGIK